ncbi:MAG: ATP synthase subunit B family protein, partial [Acidimicrobiales bacterium]
MSGIDPLQPPPLESETLLRRLIDIVNNAKPIPLSTTVRLDSKDEVLELLEEALDRLPEELRQARWLLKERSEFLAKSQREADEILEAARVRAERMVQRTEIVREAELRARRTLEEADDESRRLRHEAEDYCDHQLGRFEIVLERTLKTVQAGRDKL